MKPILGLWQSTHFGVHLKASVCLKHSACAGQLCGGVNVEINYFLKFFTQLFPSLFMSTTHEGNTINNSEERLKNVSHLSLSRQAPSVAIQTRQLIRRGRTTLFTN